MKRFLLVALALLLIWSPVSAWAVTLPSVCTATAGALIKAADWNTCITAVQTTLTTIQTGGIAITGQAIGDLLTANSTTTLTRIAAVATGQVLISQGAATAPAWSEAPTLTSLTLSATAALTLKFSGALPRVYVGSTGLTFYDNAGTNERMRLTDSGILALGTTMVTGAAAGDLVIPNAKWLRGVNNSGANTDQIIGRNASDLVAFGVARSAASVAANFSADFYIRFQDLNGAEFYVPAKNAAW